MAQLNDPIPAGALPILTIGTNHLVGRYCCPFGSPYGFGEGLKWYLYPDDIDYSDAQRLSELRAVGA